MAKVAIYVLYALVATVLMYSPCMGRRVMPWMCLEVCGFSSQDISDQLQQLSNHSSSLAAVSYERFTVDFNAGLIPVQVTDITDSVATMGLETWPMITIAEYSTAAGVFANPWPLINQSIAVGQKEGYTGFNIDWEFSTDNNTVGTQFADFLDLFATELHEEGLQLTVDVAEWSRLWNATALVGTSVDRLLDMETYEVENWSTYFRDALEVIPLSQFGLGLQTVDPSTGVDLNDGQLSRRFAAATREGVQEIDIWDMPLPDSWWPFIEAFAAAD